MDRNGEPEPPRHRTGMSVAGDGSPSAGVARRSAGSGVGSGNAPLSAPGPVGAAARPGWSFRPRSTAQFHHDPRLHLVLPAQRQQAIHTPTVDRSGGGRRSPTDAAGNVRPEHGRNRLIKRHFCEMWQRLKCCENRVVSRVMSAKPLPGLIPSPSTGAHVVPARGVITPNFWTVSRVPEGGVSQLGPTPRTWTSTIKASRRAVPSARGGTWRKRKKVKGSLPPNDVAASCR
jgi:hypothetical protein